MFTKIRFTIMFTIMFTVMMFSTMMFEIMFSTMIEGECGDPGRSCGPLSSALAAIIIFAAPNHHHHHYCHSYHHHHHLHHYHDDDPRIECFIIIFSLAAVQSDPHNPSNWNPLLIIIRRGTRATRLPTPAVFVSQQWSTLLLKDFQLPTSLIQQEWLWSLWWKF